jgi:hypothetical protein
MVIYSINQRENKPMKATPLIGAPGAGKSRWWLTNRYCSPCIRLPLPTDGNWAKVKVWLNEELKQYSALEREIVVEGTFCSSEYRKSLVKLCVQQGTLRWWASSSLRPPPLKNTLWNFRKDFAFARLPLTKGSTILLSKKSHANACFQRKGSLLG